MPNAHGTSQERTKVWKLEVQWYQATSYRRFNCHWLVQHYQSCCMVFVEGANQKVGKNSIPTWDVFMSFGNCETVFQLWLDQNWASSSWNGKILSYTTRPISCSSFCAHPNCFTGFCTFDLQDPNSFALTRCAAKSKFKSLLARRVLRRDSLMIAWASNLGQTPHSCVSEGADIRTSKGPWLPSWEPEWLIGFQTHPIIFHVFLFQSFGIT